MFEFQQTGQMLDEKQIYLDLNSSAPLHPRVKQALISFFQENTLIANPSSIHRHGRKAQKIISESKEKIAQSIGTRAPLQQILFTSSGTEANQQVIQSALLQKSQTHWITTPVEHHSVLALIEPLRSKGVQVDLVEVDENGCVQLESLKKLIRPETALVSVVWVNNETGVINPVQEIAEFLNSKQIPLHLDAAQAWGKLPIQADTLGAKFLTFSSHKIGALAGCGVIWHASGYPLSPLLYGHQEKGRRGGTENGIGILATGMAAEFMDLSQWDSVRSFRDTLEALLRSEIPDLQINGGTAPRVPQTLNLSFQGLEGEGLVMALDLEGYSVSAGSACSSGVLEPSHVLLALGRSRSEAISSIRVSISPSITWENLQDFAKCLIKVVKRCRSSTKSPMRPKSLSL